MVTIAEENFSDIYITDEIERKAYIADKRTLSALKVFEAEDFDDFFNLIESSWDGKKSSYSVRYEGVLYRVERTNSLYGVHYCARKMPAEVPSILSLNYSRELVAHLLNLRRSGGLILCAGPTGSGKTTFVSSLLKEFISREGGFAYTIEDPVEHPLDGIYELKNGSLGVCKQTMPVNGDWGASLQSALRSRPKYILLGEIRSAVAASEALRASISGHLVLSTIHANNVSDAISSLVKYASSADMSEEMAYDITSRGILCVIHQQLVGTVVKKPVVSSLFANPDTTKGCQIRSSIKGGKLNLGTIIETQQIRMSKGHPLFIDID